ncbi:MAG: TIGR04084 family radical SAM/SPASM domain-containing protein [Promethearchaeota archaeon]
MLYFIFTTPVCNLKCRYCGGTISSTTMPHRIKYSIEDLKNFIAQDDKADIAFYGGEPFLKADFMKLIMDEIPAKNFLVQTNGILIKKLGPEYLHRFHTILLSIDGSKEVTDFYRGEGVYDTVIDTVEYLRSISYEGDVIARMTVSEKNDIYESVTHLLSIPFNHIHWQLDAVWSAEGAWHNFKRWFEENYKPGIEKLIKLWIEKMKNGKILGIVPFQGIVKRMFFQSEGLPCSAGREAFAISTSGSILACPICSEFKWNNIGDIRNAIPANIKNTVLIAEPCNSCEIYRYCGGRCLFAYKERLWGEEGFKGLCDITKHLVHNLLSLRQEIEKLIFEGKIKRSMLNYPEINNTTEIIP